MKEINIAKNITRWRKEKEISQDVLANFLGVSKAAVSKWETGQSYPDIELLPKIATFFNVSIDELLNYQPQMSKIEIRLLYEELAISFHNEPFQEVLERCRKIVIEYYACYPLLLQIGALYINYSNLIKDPEEMEILLLEAKELFLIVKLESNDVYLVKQAQSLEATCLLVSNEPEKIIELLGDSNQLLISNECLQATSYRMIGDIKKAKSTLQIGSYQHFLCLLQLLLAYLSTCFDDEHAFKNTYTRIMDLSDTFQLENLHPTLLMNVYLVAAEGFLALKDDKRALELLDSYTKLVTSSIYPLELHGDDFFDMLDPWFLEISAPIPRDQESIKQDMLSALINNPVFTDLYEKQEFMKMIATLKSNQ